MYTGSQMRYFQRFGTLAVTMAMIAIICTTFVDAAAQKSRDRRLRRTTESIEMDSRVRGHLRSGDTERYELVLNNRTVFAIRMEKWRDSSLDPIVKVLSSDGTELASDDDGGGDLNSYLFMTLDAGRYIIVAGAVGDESGDYELSIEELDELETISIGDRERGRLREGDRHMYRLELRRATEISFSVVTISETNLDPRVAVLNAAGSEVASDDDGGDGNNAMLVTSLGAGTYTVVVTAYGTTEGRYRLDVERPDIRDEGSIDVGGDRRGRIDEANERHSYELSLRRSTEIIIDLEKTSGSDLDPKVSLRTEDGDEIELDDDSGDGLNSRIERRLSEGDYLIVVIGHNGSTGGYTLSISREGGRRFEREGDRSRDNGGSGGGSKGR